MIDFSLFVPNKTYAVALSGGMDSVFLFDVLLNNYKKLNISLIAINVEHGIRGDSSKSDSEFVKNLCDSKKIKCLTYEVDSVTYAKNNGLSLEQSARKLRYECFFDAINKGLCDCVVTAHHISDNVESVLLNLFRGTSLKGISGMNETDYGGKIIRPMLKTDKQTIIEYVTKNDLKYCTDETNYDDNYTRNYLRLNVIPQIKKVFPEMEKAVMRFTETAKADEDYLMNIASSGIIYEENGVKIEITQERSIFSRRVILALKKLGIEKDFEKKHADDVYGLIKMPVSTTISMPKGIKAVRDYEYVTLYKPDTPKDFQPKKFKVASYEYLDKILFIEKVEKPQNVDYKTGFYCDGDKIPTTAEIRTRKDGDVFRKFGGGTKKLNDYLTDKKVLERKRDDILLIADGKNVLFIANFGISDQIKVDNDTKNVLQLRYITKEKI